jgi:hypothetical protein
MIIDELKGSVSIPESPIAFFYFDCQDQDRQTPTSLLLSLLKQIITTLLKTPKCVVDAYEKANGDGDSLPLRELENMIFDIASGVRQIYLIIDAFDECDELTHQKTVLHLLGRISGTLNIHIFVVNILTISQQLSNIIPRSPSMLMNPASGDICINNSSTVMSMILSRKFCV